MTIAVFAETLENLNIRRDSSPKAEVVQHKKKIDTELIASHNLYTTDPKIIVLVFR
jgi:hypothetical protein